MYFSADSRPRFQARGPGAAMLRALATALLPVTALGVAACATRVSSARTHATTTAGQRARDALLGPVSASFVSPAAGYVLGLKPCFQTRCLGSALALRKTVDGGHHYLVVPAPPTRYVFQGRASASAVGHIVFADGLDGWAYGPGLWSTHNGGATWRRLDTHGMRVTSLAAAAGRVIAVFLPSAAQQRHGGRSFQGFSSPVRQDAFRPLPRANPVQGTFLATAVSVVAQGRTGYLAAIGQVKAGHGLIVSLLLTGPTDGSAPWQPPVLPAACRAGAFGLAIAAAPGDHVALACGSEPAAGNQRKRAYLSATGGRTWRRITCPPMGGYVGALSLTASGTVMLSGGRSAVYISTDGGKTWHTSPSLNLNKGALGDGLFATMVTNRFGFVIEANIYDRHIWFTSDGGATWAPVGVR